MDCTTKVFNPLTQLMEDKPKQVFETQQLAEDKCSVVNAKPNRINKVVPYKCKTCHKFHIGRNGKPLTKKYVDKLLKPKPDRGFKVVGFIDLSQITKK